MLGAYSTGLVGLGVALSRGVTVGGTLLQVNFKSPELLRSVAAIAWAPLAWNIFPRLEYRHGLLSRIVGGSKVVAHYLFAGYILAFSSFREHLFFDAIYNNDTIEKTTPLTVVGTGLLGLGVVLSASGFYHLKIKFTYMGEYFGFKMDKLIESFPFNVCPDPMYNGSSLMHFGYAFRAASPTGFFLASTTALSYWTAAKIFEEYVSMLFHTMYINYYSNPSFHFYSDLSWFTATLEKRKRTSRQRRLKKNRNQYTGVNTVYRLFLPCCCT